MEYVMNRRDTCLITLLYERWFYCIEFIVRFAPLPLALAVRRLFRIQRCACHDSFVFRVYGCIWCIRTSALFIRYKDTSMIKKWLWWLVFLRIKSTISTISFGNLYLSPLHPTLILLLLLPLLLFLCPVGKYAWPPSIYFNEVLLHRLNSPYSLLFGALLSSRDALSLSLAFDLWPSPIIC